MTPCKIDRGAAAGNRMYSLPKYLCISLLALLPALGFAKGDKRNSIWMPIPVVIDGNNSEWPQPYPFTEEIDTKMQYAIGNDSQTLYLTLKTSDETTKMKLRNNGLTLFVDTTGKKLLNTSFGFSVAGDIHPPQRHRGGGVDVEQGTEKNNGKPGQDKPVTIINIQVKGTEACDGNYPVLHNKPGVAAAAAINDYNEMVWEIAIPFKCLYADATDVTAERKKISVCFTLFGLNDNEIYEINRAKESEKSNAMPIAKADSTGVHDLRDGGGGNPVRGANGGMGVGIGNGKGGGGAPEPQVTDAVAIMQDHQRATQDNQVWKEIRLSDGPE